MCSLQSLQVQVLGKLYDRMVAGGGGQLAAGPFFVFDTPRRTQRRQQHQHCHHQWQNINEPVHGHGHIYEPVASSCFATCSSVSYGRELAWFFARWWIDAERASDR